VEPKSTFSCPYARIEKKGGFALHDPQPSTRRLVWGTWRESASFRCRLNVVVTVTPLKPPPSRSAPSRDGLLLAPACWWALGSKTPGMVTVQRPGTGSTLLCNPGVLGLTTPALRVVKVRKNARFQQIETVLTVLINTIASLE
jgi:hypothetical protein